MTTPSGLRPGGGGFTPQQAKMQTSGAVKYIRGHHAPVLDALPREVLSTLDGFLLGLDLFTLTHVSPRLREALHSQCDLLTHPRLIEYQHANVGDEGGCDEDGDAQDKGAGANETRHSPSLLELLVRAQSVRFRGATTHESDTEDRGSCIKVKGLELTRRRLPVAFDTWFSLLPGDQGTYAGGILLGAQSSSFRDLWWAHYHQQLLHVDSNLQLYCSMLDSKQPLVKLDINRWYHLALTFDGSRQLVYLDGEVIHEQDGSLHHEAHTLSCVQVGTGCITAGALNHPIPNRCGWYGFHGIVDEFRTWRELLSAEDVSKLVRGESIDQQYLLDTGEGNAGQHHGSVLFAAT